MGFSLQQTRPRRPRVYICRQCSRCSVTLHPPAFGALTRLGHGVHSTPTDSRDTAKDTREWNLAPDLEELRHVHSKNLKLQRLYILRLP